MANMSTQELRNRYEHFEQGQNFEEYCEAIKICLVNSGYGYHEESAVRLIKNEVYLLKRAYRAEETPYSIAIDIGHCCG